MHSWKNETNKHKISTSWGKMTDEEAHLFTQISGFSLIEENL